ncbi:exported hypothetical protein [uncultured Gammaproteobacteria bacterium]
MFRNISLVACALALTFSLFVSTGSALAQTQQPQPNLPSLEAQASRAYERHQVELARFALDYTRSIVIGMVSGGMIMSFLVGGSGPTLVGAVAGAVTGGGWHFYSLAQQYVEGRQNEQTGKPLGR